MIAADVRIEGFDARTWANLLSLFAPGMARRAERGPEAFDAPEPEAAVLEEPANGTLVLVVSDEHRVRKAFHTRRGSIPGLRYEGPESLPELVARHRARRVIVLREGALEEVGERIGARMPREADYLAQWLLVARTVRELIDAGLIHVFPRPLAALPIPTPAMVRRALDTVLPDERALVLVLWQGPWPWTGVVLRRRRAEIDLIAGPDLIARWAGPLGGDWRRDHRFVSDGVARAVAPVHLGIYAEVESFQALLRDPAPGAWARAVALREIIVGPTPPYVAVALAADAARAIGRRTAEYLGGLDALAPIGPLIGLVRSRISEIASVTQTLGFDPLRVLAGILARSDPPSSTEPTPTRSADAPEERDASASTDRSP